MPQDATNITTTRAEVDATRVVKLVSNAIAAVGAFSGPSRLEIPRLAHGEEIDHVCFTALIRGRREAIEFGIEAVDRQAVPFCGDKAGNEHSQDSEVVEPGAPEGGDLEKGDVDTAEEGEDDDDRRGMAGRQRRSRVLRRISFGRALWRRPRWPAR